MIRHILFTSLFVLSTLALTSCDTTQSFFNQDQSSHGITEDTHPSVVNLQGFPNDPVFWQADTSTVWNKLQHVSLPELNNAANQTTDANISGWIKLAIVSKQYSTNDAELSRQLITWRGANPNHPANSLFPSDGSLTQLQTNKRPQHIVLLLPLTGNLASAGQAVRNGFISAYYASGNRNQQTVSFLDTNENQNVGALYQQALSQGADAVIGPLTKEQVQTLAKQGGFSVPTIALNYTEIWFGSLPSNFYEFGLSPLDEAKQLAEKAAQAGHKHAIIIAPDDEWGQRVTKTLVANWNALGGTIADKMYFTSHTDLNQSIPQLLHVDVSADRKQMKNNNDKNALEGQRRQDFDVIFLLASPQNARQIVPLLKYYYADKIPIFSTSVIYSGTPSPQRDSDLNGVTFSDTPWTLSMANAPGQGGDDLRASRLYPVGRDAYLLINQISRLKLLSNFPIYGATGALTLTPQQQIYRRIAWVQMHNGRP